MTEKDEGGGKDVGEKGAGFGTLPDVLLVDGGTGHVNAVRSVLEELDFNIPVYGMVRTITTEREDWSRENVNLICQRTLCC